MKRFTICLTAVCLAVIGCFAMVACSSEQDSSSGCYIDEKSPSFAGGYYATVTDFDIADKVSIGGSDYSSDYEGGKFVVVSLTVRRSTGADDVTFTRDWFTLKVDGASVVVSDSMYTEFALSGNSAKSIDLRFDVQSTANNMTLEIAQPGADASPVVINLSARK